MCMTSMRVVFFRYFVTENHASCRGARAALREQEPAALPWRHSWSHGNQTRKMTSCTLRAAPWKPEQVSSQGSWKQVRESAYGDYATFHARTICQIPPFFRRGAVLPTELLAARKVKRKQKTCTQMQAHTHSQIYTHTHTHTQSHTLQNAFLNSGPIVSTSLCMNTFAVNTQCSCTVAAKLQKHNALARFPKFKRPMQYA